MLQPREIVQALQRLGSTADEVAQSLRAAGVRGRRYASRECPIACYLQGLGAGPVAVYRRVVLNGQVLVESDEMPRAVRLFITRFDANAYPDLVC